MIAVRGFPGLQGVMSTARPSSRVPLLGDQMVDVQKSITIVHTSQGEIESWRDRLGVSVSGGHSNRKIWKMLTSLRAHSRDSNGDRTSHDSQLETLTLQMWPTLSRCSWSWLGARMSQTRLQPLPALWTLGLESVQTKCSWQREMAPWAITPYNQQRAALHSPLPLKGASQSGRCCRE